MNFDLPLITPDARPDFTDSDSCAEWLRTLPLINVAPSHGRLLGELEELNCFDMAPRERLKVLELMREPVLFMQTEHAKKITNRAVPLARPEREILINIDALWAAMAHGYVRCAQEFAAEGSGLLSGAGSAALATQRALWCTGAKMAERYRCCRQPGPEDWILLHSLFALAEEHGFTDEQVEHPVHSAKHERWKTTCMETYSGAVLLNMANPNELTSRQLVLVARWLERLGAKARVVRALSAEVAAKTPRPVRIDLASGRGASRPDETQLATSDSLRYLDVYELGRSLRKRLAALAQDQPPSALGLGDDVPAATAQSLLTQLHLLWCENRAVRGPGRRGGTAKTALATGMGAIHYFISGLPFKQPGEGRQLSAAQRQEMETFGRVATRQEEQYQTLQGFALETWSIVDESMAGFHLRRDSGAARFLHQQLIVLRPAGSGGFSLAVARWLAVDEAYVVEMGVRSLPGRPQPVAVRPTGLNALAEKYVPALLLPAVAALASPHALILPAGWFKPRRTVEVYFDRPQTMLLTGVLDRGSDFERVSFEPY